MNRSNRPFPTLFVLALALLVSSLFASPLAASDAGEKKPPRDLAEAAAAAHDQPDDGAKHPPETDPSAEPIEHDRSLFRPDPDYGDHRYDPEAQYEIYGGKSLNKTARPVIELGRKLYVRGALEPGGTWLGKKNPTAPHFMVYGDWRTALAYNDDGTTLPNDPSGPTHQARLATRLNLDVDIKITSTERLHFFVRPLDSGQDFTRWDIDGKVEDEFFDVTDFEIDTFYFEGEAGPILRGLTGEENKVDLALSFGLMPLFTQNGIWLNDAFWGGGFALPAFSSNTLDASNIDLTFFVGLDDLTTPAIVRVLQNVDNGTLDLVPDDHGADVYGLAGFVDATQGYWEFGYGYVDAENPDLSYHNVTVAFTRRYGGWLSNSIRLIGNLGQDGTSFGGADFKTADGVLLLLENSLISHKPSTLVPYLNAFVGVDQPLPLARNADLGGVLANTGIHFESDGVTGFPTLDARGHNAWGGAIGVQYLWNLDRQIVVEAAVVQPLDEDELLFDLGDDVLKPVEEQYALGVRFQEPLNHAWILRFDVMHGWRDTSEDLFGARVEIRRKF